MSVPRRTSTALHGSAIALGPLAATLNLIVYLDSRQSLADYIAAIWAKTEQQQSVRMRLTGLASCWSYCARPDQVPPAAQY
jgi:hypothetical protein